MRVALVVGHKSTSTGAQNARHSAKEWWYNAKLAVDVWHILDVTSEIEPVVVHRRTYATLPDDINAYNPRMVVSMHCNAFDKEASGTLTLYYHRSVTGRAVAKAAQSVFVEALGLRDRGVYGITKEDRGGKLLAEVDAPAILCEPFFIDNDADYERALELDMANIYASAVKEAVKRL